MMTIRWRDFAAALCFLMFVSLVARGEEYTIKLRHAMQVGDSFPYFADASIERQVISTIPGQQPKTANEKLTVHLTGTMKVLELDEKSNASKISFAVSKCLVDGVEAFKPGDVIVATRPPVAVPVVYMVNNLPSGLDTAVFELMLPLVDPAKPDAENFFGSAAPQKVGDSWQMNPRLTDEIFKELQMPGKKEDFSENTKLMSVDKIDGKDMLQLSGGFAIKNLKGQNEVGVMFHSGEATVDFAATASADDSVPPPLISQVMNTHFTADTPGPNNSTTSVDVTLKRSQKIIIGSQAIAAALPANANDAAAPQAIAPQGGERDWSGYFQDVAATIHEAKLAFAQANPQNAANYNGIFTFDLTSEGVVQNINGPAAHSPLDLKAVRCIKQVFAAKRKVFEFPMGTNRMIQPGGAVEINFGDDSDTLGGRAKTPYIPPAPFTRGE